MNMKYLDIVIFFSFTCCVNPVQEQNKNDLSPKKIINLNNGKINTKWYAIIGTPFRLEGDFDPIFYVNFANLDSLMPNKSKFNVIYYIYDINKAKEVEQKFLNEMRLTACGAVGGGMFKKKHIMFVNYNNCFNSHDTTLNAYIDKIIPIESTLDDFVKIIKSNFKFRDIRQK